MSKLRNQSKDFLVSTADFAFYVNGTMACNGIVNLNTSIEVSVQEQNINAGKGNQLVYSYKYGRELGVTLETANWDLRYIAANIGSKITEGLTDVYKLGECVTLTDGIGVLSSIPVDGKVSVEINNDFIEIETENTTIDLTSFGLKDKIVKATYKYSRIAKTVVIDDSLPLIGELVLDADKHNNKLGKTGHIQVIIPAYQLNGNFNIDMTPDGTTSTNLDGKALAVEGDTCTDGTNVYAYIKEFDDTKSVISVADIAATPSPINFTATGETSTIHVIGLKGELYSPIELDNIDCEFVSEKPVIASVDENGIVTAVAAGTTKIIVRYADITDEVEVTVTTV